MSKPFKEEHPLGKFIINFKERLFTTDGVVKASIHSSITLQRERDSIFETCQKSVVDFVNYDS